MTRADATETIQLSRETWRKLLIVLVAHTVALLGSAGIAFWKFSVMVESRFVKLETNQSLLLDAYKSHRK